MKIKIVVIDFQIPSNLRRWAVGLGIPVALLVGGGAIAYASVPKTWAVGEGLKSADLNGNFASLDSRLTALETATGNLQSSVLTTIAASTLNLTDSATADWQIFAMTCIQQIVTNASQCTTNACASIPIACTIAAERKCVEGLGYRFGFFNGETSAANTASILCVK